MTVPGWTTGLQTRAAMAFVCGVLTVPGFAPFAISPLPPLALAALFILWRKATARDESAWLGLSYGLGCFLVGVSWIYVSLSEFGGMVPVAAAGATALFCLYLALYPALAGALFGRWRQQSAGSFYDALLFAGLWMLAEWLRGTVFTGFPWLAVGYSQAPHSPLAGWATVLGAYGVGFIVALIGALLGNIALTGWRRTGPWLAIILLLAGGALLRAMDWTQPVGEPMSVSLLQGNIAQNLKWDPQHLPLSIETYVRLANDRRSPPPQLVVLPETSLPLFFSQVPHEVLQALTRQSDALLGVAVNTQDGGYANGAVALTRDPKDADKALKISAYAKHHLVPFGEFAPPGFAWFFKFANIPLSSFTAGRTQQAPLEVAGQRLAINICYEDVFGEELLTALPTATLLVNLSNTAWFGNSWAQPQHLQIAQLRAIETGRTILRATNTGMTAMIRPDGQIAAILPPFSSGALRVEAQGYSGLTPYAQWGNALALLLAIGSCLAAWRCRRVIRARAIEIRR